MRLKQGVAGVINVETHGRGDRLRNELLQYATIGSRRQRTPQRDVKDRDVEVLRALGLKNLKTSTAKTSILH